MGEEEGDAFVHQIVADWRQAALAPGDRRSVTIPSG